MKLTIVITVYNKEPYLHRIFDSVLNQQNTVDEDYEVLAVNDGSTDGSSKILKEYEMRDKRVRVLTQQNQGLSIARNNGLKGAKGEYVWFVDADDKISSKAVSFICGAMVVKPDIIPIYAKTEGSEIIRNQIPQDVKSGKEILLSTKWEVCGVFNVFSKNFLCNNNLFFYPHIFHEDTEFTPRVLYAAKSVKVVPEILYIVYKTPGSITTSPNPKRAYDCLYVAESNYNIIIDNNEMGTEIGRALCLRVSGTITNCLNLILENNKSEWAKFNKALYGKRYLFHSMEKTGVLRYWLLAKLFKIFPNRYVQVFKALRMMVR